MRKKVILHIAWISFLQDAGFTNKHKTCVPASGLFVNLTAGSCQPIFNQTIASVRPLPSDKYRPSKQESLNSVTLIHSTYATIYSTAHSLWSTWRQDQYLHYYTLCRSTKKELHFFHLQNRARTFCSVHKEIYKPPDCTSRSITN